MARQVDQSDLLDFIEGAPLAPDKASRLEAIFEADPSLRRWAQEARRDRDRLHALWEIESRFESPGLVQTAMEQSERDVLLGDAPLPFDTARARMPRVRRPVRRIRVTPVRLVAAAGIIIVTASATLVGVFFQNRPTPGPQLPQQRQGRFAQAPPGFEQSTIEKPTALADATRARENAPFAQEGSPAGANTRTQERALMKADDVEINQAADSPTRLAQAQENNAKDAKLALTPLSFHLIHSSEHAPAHALAPARAAQLALSGRLLLLIRADNPKAVEASLLQSSRSDDPLDPRWRSVLELTGAQAADGAEPGSDAARVVLVDVLATPEAMERLIASATRAAVGADGAWLQEIADPVHIEPRLDNDDLLWWTRPITAWARRVAAPVLIERAGPGDNDASAPDAEKPQH